MNAKIPGFVQKELERLNYKKLRPSQEKAIQKGLFQGKNLLICTPTASGKTFVGELAFINLLNKNNSGEKDSENFHPITIYIVPLKALASEKFREFSKRYPNIRFALTSGDMDSDDRYLEQYDVIITTSEKFDSLLRHHTPWLPRVRLVIIDEIHLLNDVNRGPVLEIIITTLKNRKTPTQLIGLSATIGNAKDLARWLDAELVIDNWRPVRLDKKIYFEGELL